MKLMPPLSNLEFGELFLLEIIKTSVTLLGVPSISCVVCILSSGATVFLDQRCYGNTLDLFSGSDRAGLVLWRWPFPVLYPCRLVELYQACVPAEREGRGRGDAVGEGRDWELFRACLHLQNKERGWQKDYSGYFLTVEGYVCDVASHCYIHRPVYVPENHSLLPPFFVFLLFCSLASPHSCFLYYFISVSESLSLPPPLSHSSSFFPPSLLLHPFLPPTSHLCMCHFQL